MTTLRHARPGGRRAWVRPVVVGAALVLGAGIGTGGTFALWNDGGGSTPGAVITTGDLDLTLVGTPVWKQTSSDIAGTPAVIDPATFLVRPGDMFTIEQKATVRLQGQNLTGQFGATFPSASLPAGAVATFTVSDGTSTTPQVSMGSGVIFQFSASNAGVTKDVTVTVTVNFPSTMANTVKSPGTTNGGVAATFGPLALTLNQVR